MGAGMVPHNSEMWADTGVHQVRAESRAGTGGDHSSTDMNPSMAKVSVSPQPLARLSRPFWKYPS